MILLGGIIIAFAIAYVLSDATGLNDLRRTFETYDFFGTSEVTSDFNQYQTRYKRFATNGKVYFSILCLLKQKRLSTL